MSTQPHFDGKTYVPQLDHKRLSHQLNAVREYMLMLSQGVFQWATLEEIAKFTGYPEASVSSRLRDLRKPRFGAYQVDRRRVSQGLFEYRVTRGDK